MGISLNQSSKCHRCDQYFYRRELKRQNDDSLACADCLAKSKAGRIAKKSKRPCLKCGKHFISAGFNNRLCYECRNIEPVFGGMTVYYCEAL